MMKLAVNYSRPLLDVLEAGEEVAGARIDYIKLSRAEVMAEELEQARRYRPGLLHHLLHLGAARQYWESFDFDQLNRELERAGSPYLSVHLDAYRNELGELGEADLLAALRDNYQLIKEQIRLDLIVENCDQAPVETISAGVGRFPVLIQPGWIAQFLAHSGADLLLDLSHARCAAHTLRQERREYLAALPLGRVREIHNAGSRLMEGQMIDNHFCLEEEDYQTLDWVLTRAKPEILTLEYGGTGQIYVAPAVVSEKNNPALLREQVVRLGRVRDANG